MSDIVCLKIVERYKKCFEEQRLALSEVTVIKLLSHADHFLFHIFLSQVFFGHTSPLFLSESCKRNLLLAESCKVQPRLYQLCMEPPLFWAMYIRHPRAFSALYFNLFTPFILSRTYVTFHISAATYLRAKQNDPHRLLFPSVLTSSRYNSKQAERPSLFGALVLLLAPVFGEIKCVV